MEAPAHISLREAKNSRKHSAMCVCGFIPLRNRQDLHNGAHNVHFQSKRINNAEEHANTWFNHTFLNA